MIALRKPSMEQRKMARADPKAGRHASFSPTLKKAGRFVIMVVGTTVLFLGMAMIVLPGPAFVVIPVGLAIQGTEFALARRWLRLIRDSAQKGASKVKLYGIVSGEAAGDRSGRGASSSAGPCNEPVQRNSTE
jgi:hypothetical protein